MEQQLALPVGFVLKTVKAFLCLTADGRFLGLELSDDRAYAAPDIGSLANGTNRCNPLVEKSSIVIPEAASAKSCLLYTSQCGGCAAHSSGAAFARGAAKGTVRLLRARGSQAAGWILRGRTGQLSAAGGGR